MWHREERWKGNRKEKREEAKEIRERECGMRRGRVRGEKRERERGQEKWRVKGKREERRRK